MDLETETSDKYVAPRSGKNVPRIDRGLFGVHFIVKIVQLSFVGGDLLQVELAQGHEMLNAVATDEGLAFKLLVAILVHALASNCEVLRLYEIASTLDGTCGHVGGWVGYEIQLEKSSVGFIKENAHGTSYS